MIRNISLRLFLLCFLGLLCSYEFLWDNNLEFVAMLRMVSIGVAIVGLSYLLTRMQGFRIITPINMFGVLIVAMIVLSKMFPNVYSVDTRLDTFVFFAIWFLFYCVVRYSISIEILNKAFLSIMVFITLLGIPLFIDFFFGGLLPINIGFPIRLLLIMSFFYFLDRYITTKDRWDLLFIFVAAVNIFISLHKPTIFSFLAGLFVFLLLIKRDRVRYGGFILAIAFALVIGVMLLPNEVYVFYGELIRERFFHDYGTLDYGNSEDVILSFLGGRDTLWLSALPVISSSPYWGVGFNFLIFEETNGLYIPLHNGYMDFIVSVGVVGFIAFVFLIGSYVRKFIVLNHKMKEQSNLIWMIPFFSSVMFYNIGGTSRLFPVISALIFIIFAYVDKLYYEKGEKNAKK